MKKIIIIDIHVAMLAATCTFMNKPWTGITWNSTKKYWLSHSQKKYVLKPKVSFLCLWETKHIKNLQFTDFIPAQSQQKLF